MSNDMTFEKKLQVLGRIQQHKKPDILTLEEWQIALRKQYAVGLRMGIANIGAHPYYSDFEVNNPVTSMTYKVAIRSHKAGNFCSCMDFKTNSLGTCKHIEYVLYHIQNDSKTFQYSLDAITPRYTSIYLKYGAERTIMIRIGSEKKHEFGELAHQYFDSNFELKMLGYDRFEEILAQAKAIHPEFRCYPDAMDFILEQRARRRRVGMMLKSYDPEKKPDSYTNLVKAKLFPYQIQGVFFAVCAGKSLIADDMGLGKTIQAIAATQLMKKELGVQKILIVCPTSLKYQWKSEIQKFTDSTVTVIEGSANKRLDIYQNDTSLYKIISYNTLSNDVKELNQFEPDLVIIDEAQRIKNWKTKISQQVKKVKSEYAIVLTGTPLENKIEELYSIIQFVDAYSLGPLYKFLNKHEVKDDMGKVVGYQNLNQIGQELSDILIRRRKKQVLKQLPERMDKNLLVTMTKEQMDIHSENADTVARLVNKWKRSGFLNEKDRQRLMICLNLMRMACDSTFVIDQNTRHDTKIDELMNIINQSIEQEEKVVVFSQWERMTRIVAGELNKQKIKFEYLHGGIPSEKRQDLFTNFTNDPDCRVFLSTDAGGVGLNLQAASVLVNLDIPWNPAVLEQRIARVHRLGQNRNVSIINLVSAGTIEHRMLGVLKFKSSMAEGVLDSGEDNIFMGDDRFKQFMNDVQQIANVSDTQGKVESEAGDIEELEELVLPNLPNDVEIPEEPSLDVTAAIVQETPPPHEPETIFDPVAINESQSTENTKNESPEALIQMGTDFLGRLVQTLSDKEATARLVSSLVETDQQTGKQFVKIPVENEKVVENALSLFSGLMGLLKK